MKQELLQFILDNVTDTMKLKTTEHLTTGNRGTRVYYTTKERTYAVIRDFFDNNLLGHTPNDFSHITKIDAWEVVSIV